MCIYIECTVRYVTVRYGTVLYGTDWYRTMQGPHVEVGLYNRDGETSCDCGGGPDDATTFWSAPLHQSLGP